MTTQVDNEYFNWLISQIDIVGKQRRTYSDLFNMLHDVEFVWSIQGDDNRVQDGKDLRLYFSGGRKSSTPDLDSVSILEVLIGLSRKIAFVAGGNPGFWAWQLIDNLGLSHCHDPLTDDSIERVQNILVNLIYRKYEKDGRGGFFPLVNPSEDQTQIQIWHQLNEYVNEIQEPS